MMSTAVWSRSMVLRSAMRLLLPTRRPRDALTVPHPPPGGRQREARAPRRAAVGPRPQAMLLGEPWREDTRTVDGSTREKWACMAGVTCHGRGAYATGIKREGRYSRQPEEYLGIAGSTRWHGLRHVLLSVEERPCLLYWR